MHRQEEKSTLTKSQYVVAAMTHLKLRVKGAYFQKNRGRFQTNQREILLLYKQTLSAVVTLISFSSPQTCLCKHAGSSNSVNVKQRREKCSLCKWETPLTGLQHNRLMGGVLLWFNTPAVLPHHGTNPPNCQTTAACAKKRFVSGSAEVSLVVECHRL